MHLSSSINEINEYIEELKLSKRMTSVCADICVQIVMSFEYMEFNEMNIDRIVSSLRNVKDPCNIDCISSIINKIRRVCGKILQEQENSSNVN